MLLDFDLQSVQIKCSYETKYHSKKLSNNEETLFSIKPKGIPCFVYYKNNKCYFIDSRDDTNVQILTTDYTFPNNSLFYGSKFYTYKNGIKSNYFCIETIHYFDNVYFDDYTNLTKLQLFEAHLNNNKNNTSSSAQNNCVKIRLCVTSVSADEIVAYTKQLDYQIYCIQCRSINNKNNEYSNIFNFDLLYKPVPQQQVSVPVPVPVPQQSKKQYHIFNISADIQNDIYYVHLHDKSLQIAHIPDYKTSVMMNNIFRNIKENTNLDAMEESDDEDDFENINVDKYVNLEKIVKMKCIYHYKFKKWQPYELNYT